jgi:hypothetical protein
MLSVVFKNEEIKVKKLKTAGVIVICTHEILAIPVAGPAFQPICSTAEIRIRGFPQSRLHQFCDT